MSKISQKIAQNFKSAPAVILQKIGQFRAESAKDIGDIDALIEQKLRELVEIHQGVCLEDAAALIERSIRASLDERRDRLYRTAALARDLAYHADVRLSRGHNGIGQRTFHDLEKKRLEVTPYDMDSLDVLALVWSDKEVKAFAESAALAAGAKPAPDGLTVGEAVQRSNVLLAEIESLEETRQQAAAVLAELSGVSLSKFSQEAEKAAIVLDEITSTQTTGDGPTVKVRGADGVMRPYQADPFAWRGD